MKNKNLIKIKQNETSLQEDFEYRPFLKLAAKNFIGLKPAETRNKVSKSADIEEDKALFLKTIQSLSQKDKDTGIRGFLLSDHCTLPDMKKPKQEKNIIVKKKDAAKTSISETNEFLTAMRNTKPLRGKGRNIAPKPDQLTQVHMEEANFADMLKSRLEFSLVYSDEYLEGRVSDLDDLLMIRLREGQMSPEAHLDLHGLNASQAFEELKIFIRNSWFKGMRVVLVITGRGLNSPAGQGVLRRKVQEWLSQEPFKRVVLAFCTACPKDGGPGSIYVLLRRYRKKGHISWNKLPADADLYPF